MNNKKKVEQLILQSIEGMEVESSKIDFKSKWYDLNSKNKKGINEFLKDTTAIANTFGLDGYIIIGYDDKTKEVIGTKFSDSNLKDTSELPYLIIKHCSDVFDLNYFEMTFQEKNIGIIHIPSILHKPIIIKNHQTFDKQGNLKKSIEHRIFVRRGTSTFPANKNDLELMYYDRKNVILEYSYSIDIVKVRCVNSKYSTLINSYYHDYILSFIFENLGTRTYSITNYILIGIKNNQEIKFSFRYTQDERGGKSSKLIANHYLSNIVKTQIIHFRNEDFSQKINDNYFDSFKLILETSKGKVLVEEIENSSSLFSN